MIVKNPTYVKVEVPAPSRTNLLVNDKLEELTVEDIALNDNTVTHIRDYAFSGLTSLKKVTLPSATLTIGQRAFSDCSNLKNINFPINLQQIGVYAFASSGISGTRIFLNSNTNLLYGAFAYLWFDKLRYGKSGNTIQGAVVETAPQYSNYIEINEGVIGLDKNFNYRTKVNFLILPSTLTKILAGSGGSIKNIIIKAETPPTLTDTYYFNILEKIYVPSASISAYKSATNWASVSSKYYPLVNAYEDLSSIDTATYSFACVKGNELGIEDDDNYKTYQYIESQWYEE